MRRHLALLAVLALATGALAEGGSRAAPVSALPAYAQECGACHVAYPPGLLPAASWERLMGSLSKHFGTDASLDPAMQREISRWLGANAGTYKRVREAPPEDRITASAWFVRKHSEVAPAVWRRPAVAGAANCTACHAGAAQGRFSEHDVRIPQ